MIVQFKNTKKTLASLGDVELKHVSNMDILEFFKILQNKLPEKDFVLEILFHQLIKPEIDYEKFQKIPEKEIEELGKAFIEVEKQIFESFQDTGIFFKDFKQALLTFCEKHNKELKTTFKLPDNYANVLLKESPIQQAFDQTHGTIAKLEQEMSNSSFIQQLTNFDLEPINKIQDNIKNTLISHASSFQKTINSITEQLDINRQAGLDNYTIQRINDLLSNPTFQYAQEMRIKAFNNATSMLQQNLSNLLYNENTLQAFNQIAETFKQFHEQYNDTLITIADLLIPAVDLWQKWIDQNKIIFDKYSILWEALQQEYNITEKKAVKVLRKYKWFITPSFPTSFIYKIVKLDKKQGRQYKAVNECFLKYFKAKNWRNLEIMVKGWENKPLLKKRYKILLDCEKAVRILGKKGKNEANIILPTLISQIDGVFTDYLNSKGIKWDCDYDDLIDNNGLTP